MSKAWMLKLRIHRRGDVCIAKPKLPDKSHHTPPSREEDTMNRTFARIEEIFVEGGVTKARVVVNGRRLSVALTLMLDARVGDEVVLESGFAFPVPSRKHKKTVEESGAEV